MLDGLDTDSVSQCGNHLFNGVGLTPPPVCLIRKASVSSDAWGAQTRDVFLRRLSANRSGRAAVALCAGEAFPSNP